MNTYAYVEGDPLNRMDPTGEFVQFVVPGIIGVGTVFGFYCYGKGIEACQKKYPNYRYPTHPDRSKYLKCISGVTGVVGRGLGMSTDPISSASSAVGEEVGKKNSCGEDQCK